MGLTVCQLSETGHCLGHLAPPDTLPQDLWAALTAAVGYADNANRTQEYLASDSDTVYGLGLIGLEQTSTLFDATRAAILPVANELNAVRNGPAVFGGLAESNAHLAALELGRQVRLELARALDRQCPEEADDVAYVDATRRFQFQSQVYGAPIGSPIDLGVVKDHHSLVSRHFQNVALPGDREIIAEIRREASLAAERRKQRQESGTAGTHVINYGSMTNVAIGSNNTATAGNIDAIDPTQPPPKQLATTHSADGRPAPKRRTKVMSDKKDLHSKGSVTNVGGHMIASAIGDGNMIETGGVTIYEQRIKQSVVPAELAVALIDALKGIQESSLSETLKREAVADHAKLTVELKKPEAEREPTLLKKFWRGLWSVADKVPSVVKLYEALQNHVPGLEQR